MSNQFINEINEIDIESKKAYPEVFDYLTAVVKVDSKGHILSCNEAFKKQYEYEHIKSVHLLEVLQIETSLQINGDHYFERALSGDIQSFSARVFQKNGQYIDTIITLIPTNNCKEIYVILSYTSELQPKKEQIKMLVEFFNRLKHGCKFYYDINTEHYYLSREINSLLNISSERTLSLSLEHFLYCVHPDDQERLKTTIEKSVKEKVGHQIEFRIIQKNQATRVVWANSEVVLDRNGNLDGMVGYVQDITDFYLPEGINKEKKLNILFDNPNLGIWSANIQDDKVICTSKGVEYITGYKKECFNGAQQWASIILNEDMHLFYNNQRKLKSGQNISQQYRIKHKSGKLKWIKDYTIPTFDHLGNIIRLDGIISDITEQKLLEDQLNFLANYDSLTKLPNRKKFIEELEQLIQSYAKSNEHFAVIKLDIDNFKYINDTLGNEIGDELLQKYPNRIKKHLASQDIIARRSGDGFAILIKQIESFDALIEKVKNIYECLKAPFIIKEYKLYVTTSFGISTFPENGFTSSEILRNARLALSIAEKEGKDNFHLLSPSSSHESYKQYCIGRDLKKALEDNEMTLYFQPRICTKTNKIIGAEALIRWNHPEWGIIPPNEFLPLAEENGLITEIDYWVLNVACQQINRWKQKGLRVVPISINISGVQLIKPDWIHKVEKVLHDANIKPSELEMEITEHILLNDSEMVKQSLTKLKALGIKLALDDFGTGYSSLSYLSQYPFDIIKIDRAFIRNMDNSKRELHLIKSIIYMIRGLNLRVVAEGVETMKQLHILQQEQCHEIQGYLFSKPTPAKEFEILLQNNILTPSLPNYKDQF